MRLRDGSGAAGPIEDKETDVVAGIDLLNFRCADCGLPVLLDDLELPEDSEVVTCYGCGQQFGTFAEVKKAMIEARKLEIDKSSGTIDQE
jgi:hypothetical protein